MAATKLDLFGQIDGIDFHVELVPSDGESGMDLLKRSVAALRKMGAQPRPQPMRGGSGGATRPAPKVIGTCPTCGADAVERSGTGKNGKPYRLHHCQKECGWKEFQAA